MGLESGTPINRAGVETVSEYGIFQRGYDSDMRHETDFSKGVGGNDGATTPN